MNIWVQVGPSGRPRRVTSERDWDITEYLWKGRYLIYPMGANLFRVDVKRDTVVCLTRFKNASVGLIDSLEGTTNCENEVLIQVKVGGRNTLDVYRFNVVSRKGVVIARNSGSVRRWIADDAGRVLAGISLNGRKECLLTRPNERSRFRSVRAMDFRRSINRNALLVHDSKNDRIYAISGLRRNRNTAAVAVISAKTGREIRCLYKNQRVDIEDFTFSKKRKVAATALFYNAKLRLKPLDQQMASIFRQLRRGLSGYILRIVANDAAEKKFVVSIFRDRAAGGYYLFDASRPRGRLHLLGPIAPWLKPRNLAPVRPIRFKSRDDLTIHGYLTLPVGRRAKNLPLVVNVHGGPEMRDYWEYNMREGAEVQFLANRGYAVFQVNFRGSVGYGRSFWMKGFRQRGRKMQNDVTDGVGWLIKRGIADPNRIAIYGKSYGGYAALAGITFTPNLYKAGVSYAGVSNWVTWLEDKMRDKQYLPQMYARVGDPRKPKDRKRLEAVAPALHADKIKVPVFLAHGGRDTQAAKTESDQMVAALMASRPPSDLDVEYMVKPKEGHTFQLEENRIEFYRAMEVFLAKHLRLGK